MGLTKLLHVQFDPEQFTMERLTRNPGSLKGKAPLVVRNQPYDEVSATVTATAALSLGKLLPCLELRT